MPSEPSDNLPGVSVSTPSTHPTIDPALGPLADLVRWIGTCGAWGAESPPASRAIEAILEHLRGVYRDAPAERRPELAAAVRALVARRPPPGPGPAEPAGRPLGVVLDALGVQVLRPGQDRAIAAALAGRDALVVMATGSGKSLCYQAPAAVMGGLTVVISPLIALMNDQLIGLRAAGIAAAALNSSLGESEQREVLGRAARGELSLLYVAPERFNSAGFRSALSRARIDLLVVDEAHCVSEWGHEFRPDYRRVGGFRQEVRPRATLALTATAPARVRRDIMDRLGIGGALEVVGGFDRPNIVFDAAWIEGKGSVGQRRAILERLVAGVAEGKVIIYCGTRRATDETAEWLTSMGHRAVPYHAGRTDRAAAQEAFTSGDVRVVTATNAFGMGVNVPDVRLVAHITMPDSLEQLYQEAGRAGRDGEAARHVIMAGKADEMNVRRRIGQARIGRGLVEELVARLGVRADAEGYFRLDRAECDDDTGVHLALAERVGVLEILGAPGGGREGRLRVRALDDGHRTALDEQVRVEMDRRTAGVESVVAYARAAHCRRQALLWHFDDPNEPAPEERCCDHCAQPVDLLVPEARLARAASAPTPASVEVDRLEGIERARYEALRRWRGAVAAEIGWPAFRVSANRTLAAIAVANPHSVGQLADVRGVGPWFCDNYGSAVIELLEGIS